MYGIVRVLAALMLVGMWPTVAAAHGLGGEAKLKEGRVQVEGYFDDDTPAAEARVWVVDAAKKRLHEGRMDAKGRWSFPAPGPGRYRVTIDAGGGHRTTISVTVPGTPTQAVEEPEAKGEGDPVVVSEGKSREEFTRFPWGRLALGLGLIGFVAMGLPWLLRSLRGSTEEKAA